MLHCLLLNRKYPVDEDWEKCLNGPKIGKMPERLREIVEWRED